MSAPDRIWLQYSQDDEPATTWCEDKISDDDIEYVRKDIADAELEVCCELVLAMGLSTGHGESQTELMKEVLTQFRKLRERS